MSFAKIEWCERKTLHKVPHDLACAPYLDEQDEQDKRALAQMKRLGVVDASKLPKEEVDYSESTGDDRCRIMIHTPPSVASVAAQPRGIPPLFKADTVNIAVSASKDGKLRVVYGGWDDAKVVLPNEVLELRWGKQGVEARIIPRRQGKR
jgi:hypothetical protein